MSIERSYKFLRWHYQLDSVFSDPIQARGEQTAYFKRVLMMLSDDDLSRDQFIADVFHYIAGLAAARVNLDTKDRANLSRFVSKCWTGKGFAPVRLDSHLINLMRRSTVAEDLYSTYYGLGLLLLSECDYLQYTTVLNEVNTAYFRPSGWVYNAVWSETIEAKRFDIELCLQALIAIRLAIILKQNPNDLPFDSFRKRRLIDYLSAPRYMTAAYYALQCLNLLGVEDEEKRVWEPKFTDFVIAHYDPRIGGFNEYLFEFTKVFHYEGMEGATSKAIHRFHSDQLAPSINATTYAIVVAQYLSRKLGEFVRSQSAKILQFFQNQVPGEDGGYGSPVLMARYITPFGSPETPLETLNWLIGKKILLLM